MADQTKGYAELAGYGAEITGAIDRVIDEFVATLPELSHEASWAIESVREYSLRPGKRIRGSLAAAAYEAVSNTPDSSVAVRIGAAIELYQSHLLIIDDVIDHSTIRRGLPTVHERYKTEVARDAREADMVGILIGLLPGQIANHVIMNLATDGRQKALLARYIAEDMAVTDLAQIDDIRQQFGRDIAEDELLRKHEQKSSYYSFVSPLTCGLILGGVDVSTARQAALAFGLPVGVAFQLRDDYLGVFGESESTGKPVLDDLREGKYTLMVHYAEQNGTEADLTALRRLLGDEQADTAELDEFREILNDTGAVARVDEVMKRYVETAITAAHDTVAWSEDFADTLAGLVTFAVQRKG